MFFRKKLEPVYSDSISFARDITSKRVEYPMGQGHILIGGTTNSGKSGVINSMMHSGSVNPNMQFIGLDPKQVELTLWEDRFCMVATNSPQMEIAIGFVITVMDQRYNYLRRLRKNKWNSKYGCWINLVVDELAEVASLDKSQGDDKEQKAHLALRMGGLESIARLGRAAGIQIWSCTQRPSQKILPEQYRDQHAFRLCLAVKESTTSKMVLSTNVVDASTLGFETPGRGFYLAQNPMPLEIRADHITEEMAMERAFQTKFLKMPIPDSVQDELDKYIGIVSKFVDE